MKLGEAILYLTSDNSGLESGLDDAESKASQSTSKIGGVLTGISMGIGQSIFNFVGQVGGAAVDMAKDALESYASYERLASSLQSLVARELIQNSGTEKYVKTGTAKLELTEKERAKLADLELQQRKLNDQIAIGEQNLAEATAKGKESAAELDLRKIRLEEMRAKLAETGTEIEKLHDKDGKLVDITKRVVEGQMSMSEAMAQAGPKAKELLNWIEKLAVQSPFNQDDVAQAFKLAMSYGFTTDEAQKLTQTMIDFAAGSGQSGQTMGQIALALGQIHAKGKLAGGEMMQLTNAGVPVRQILAKAFGVTTEQLEKMIEHGLIPADKAIGAITDSLNQDFAGAAQAQSNTFSGLLASLEDIKSIGLRELFAGSLQAVQPYLASVVNVLTDPSVKDKIAAFGDAMGQKVAAALERISAAIKAFREGGIAAAIKELNLPPEVMSAYEFGSKHIKAFEGALRELGVVLAGAAIATALASIAAGIAAIFTPIGLITIAAMVLGAAWYDNWGGIQEKTAAVGAFLAVSFDKIIGGVNKIWETMKTWWAWLSSIASGTMELMIKAPDWIVTLVAWTWPLLGPVAWVTALMAWLWPEFIAQPAWVKTLVDWLWPKMFDEPSWVGRLVDWAWPKFPGQPAWLSDLLDWAWPKLPSLPSWLGGSGGDTGTGTGGSQDNVTGSSVSNVTQYAQRNGRTLTPALAVVGAGRGSRTINITVNAMLSNQVDVRKLGRQLAGVIEATERFGG